MIDLHCHILPGLDDGARTIEESVAMARLAAEDGVRTIVATPHLFRGQFGAGGFGVIELRRRELAEEIRRQGIALEILAGAEVHISHNLIEEIRKNRAYLVLAGSPYMFLEFPTEHVFSGVRELLFELMTEGVTPIIAHPERNSVFTENPGLLFDLIEMGGLAQANGRSFMGGYGSLVEETAFRFLEWNFIHFIASDGHSPRSRPPRLSEAVRAAARVIGEKNASALVEDNPRAVLAGGEPVFHPDPINPSAHRKKLKVPLPVFFKARK
ncbi:MAG TPA: hypothetical protein PLX50_05135 [Candidatus Aminicenantes bacterium]|nr:hypothetical protein [Candidatus Aminicenantes bacterium]